MLSGQGWARRWRESWRPLRHAYALAAIVGGWVLFRCDTLAHAGAYYAALMGIATNDATAALRYPLRMLLDNLTAATLVAACIGAMPVGRWLLAKLAGAGTIRHVSSSALFGGEWLWLALVLAASCAYLASGTYNPFIYFRF